MVSATGLVLGCQPQALVPAQPSMRLEVSAQVLMAPNGTDWFSQHVSSPSLSQSRIAHVRGLMANPPAEQRQLLAWPGAASGWSPSGTFPGVPLTTYGCTTTDSVPNGPASTWYGGSVPKALYNKLFFLTREGKFIKVDKYNPSTDFEVIGLNKFGKTFSKTYVTLSPSCSRAYCLADDGTLYVVDTQSMTVVTSLKVGGGYGIAPCIDPLRSKHDDSADHLYVPGNDGNVTRYVIGRNGLPSSTTTYGVATGVTPVSGTYKIASPAGIEDQPGHFVAHDQQHPKEELHAADLDVGRSRHQRLHRGLLQGHDHPLAE
ncbi:MAG: hypothetical protein ACLGIN_14570 [Candidatus Sericytochromatia bacterium]